MRTKNVATVLIGCIAILLISTTTTALAQDGNTTLTYLNIGLHDEAVFLSMACVPSWDITTHGDWALYELSPPLQPNGVPIPNATTTVIVSHNYTLFSHLRDAQIGDTLVLERDGRVEYYTVSDVDFISDDQLHVFTQVHPLALITCVTAPSNPARLVVYADRTYLNNVQVSGD